MRTFLTFENLVTYDLFLKIFKLFQVDSTVAVAGKSSALRQDCL